MTVAQGIERYIVFAEQSALGTPATTGGQKMRRRTGTFVKAVATYENDEIVSHQQSTGSTAGQQSTTGNLDALLSPGTYSKLFANLLRKDFAATTAITGASITVAGSGPTYTVTRAAGSFLTDGIKAGDIVRLTAGAFAAGNLNKNLQVVSLTALVLTVRTLNGSALAAEGPVATATVTVPGKKCWVPMTSHTNKYFTVEDVFPDLTKAEQFNDVKVGSAAFNLPATGNAGVVFACPGLSRTRLPITIAAPADESTTTVVSAVNGVLLVGGAVVAVTGIQFTIDGGITTAEPEAGTNAASDHQRGRIKVSGSFTAKFSGSTLQDAYDDQTPLAICMAITDSGAANADFVTAVMSKLKLFGDAPDDGEKEIIRTYPFTAEINGSGGAALANLQTIFSMQDSQAA
jgi:hypothetical protein